MVAAVDPALNGEPLSFQRTCCECVGGRKLTLSPVDAKGLYLKDCQIEDPAPHASDPEIAERLWHLSEDLVGQKFSLD